MIKYLLKYGQVLQKMTIYSHRHLSKGAGKELNKDLFNVRMEFKDLSS